MDDDGAAWKPLIIGKKTRPDPFFRFSPFYTVNYKSSCFQ